MSTRNAKYSDELKRLLAKLEDLDTRHRRSLAQFEDEKAALEAGWREQLRRKQNECEARELELERTRRNLLALEGEFDRRQKDHEALVRRLRDELQGLAGQFEESKRNMQLLFEKQLQEKEEELRQQFELVLRQRELEK